MDRGRECGSGGRGGGGGGGGGPPHPAQLNPAHPTPPHSNPTHTEANPPLLQPPPVQWREDVKEVLLPAVAGNIDKFVLENWTREEKDACLAETATSFQMGGKLLSHIK